MVNLIFEGADCSGKSSIIAEFTKRKKFKVFHFQQPPKLLTNPEKAEFQRKHFYLMLDYMLNDYDVIFDRFHIGEKIYAPLFRGYEPGFVEDIEAQLDKSCVLIYVYCSNRELLKRFDNRGIEKSQLIESSDAFMQAFRESKLTKIMIDTTEFSAKKCYFKIMKTLGCMRSEGYF